VYKANVHYLNGRDTVLMDRDLSFILSRLAQLHNWTSATVTNPEGGEFEVKPSDVTTKLRIGLVIK